MNKEPFRWIYKRLRKKKSLSLLTLDLKIFGKNIFLFYLKSLVVVVVMLKLLLPIESSCRLFHRFHCLRSHLGSLSPPLNISCMA